MALAEFLRNIRMARNILILHLYPHLNLRGQRQPLPIDRQELDGKAFKATTPVWLSPHVVSAFDPDDFRHLPADGQAELTAVVKEYREVAEAVAGREPTRDETGKALAALQMILGLVYQGELDVGPEEGGLLAALYATKKSFPDFALGFDFALDTDASGDPGIWIWVIVPDDIDPDSQEFQTFTEWFPKAVRAALSRTKSERLPYIHYRTVSEAVELMGEGVA